MAKKQVLQISNYSGGLNSYSDPRDLKENEFQVLDNAAVDEEGIIRVSGGLELKNNIELSLVEEVNTLLKSGKGLFSYATDYYQSQSTLNTYLEPISSSDTSSAWGVTDDDGQGTWAFGQNSSNTNDNSSGYFGMEGSIAVNYITYSANTSYNHGSLSHKGLNLKPGLSYRITFDITNENPWFYLGSNIPPRIRLYNSTLGKYLYPDGFSDTSDATHDALITTAQGNMANDDFFDDTSGSASTTEVAVDTNTPVSSNAAHLSYNAFFGTTATSGTTTNAKYLKLVSSTGGDPFTSGNYTDSTAIGVTAGETYLLDCIYNTNGTTTGSGLVGVRIVNNQDTQSTIPFNNGTGYGNATSEWMHINSPTPEGYPSTATPAPLEFTIPTGCETIDIRIGVDNNAGGSADEAYFSGFNLRRKTYELQYVGESTVSEFVSFYKYPNSFSNEQGGSIQDSPYIPSISLNPFFQKDRNYYLDVTIPSGLDDSNDWVFSIEAGKWGGINQTGVNNFVVGSIDIKENISDNSPSLTISSEGKGYNIIEQEFNEDNLTTNINLYSYNPIDNLYNKQNLPFPQTSNSLFKFVRGSKDVYFCDETFNNGNLYSLSNTDSQSIEVNTVNFIGPSIGYSSEAAVSGVDPAHTFDVASYYAPGSVGSHAGNTSVANNSLALSMVSDVFYDALQDEGHDESMIEAGIFTPEIEKFNQFTGESNDLDHTDTGVSTIDGAFAYDTDDGAWLNSANPYTKYIVIRNQDIVGTGEDKLLTGTRIAQVEVDLSHWIAMPILNDSSLIQTYIPNMTIYLDVIDEQGADCDASPPNADGSQGGYVNPGDPRFIDTIGEVKVNPALHSLGPLDSSLNSFYETTTMAECNYGSYDWEQNPVFNNEWSDTTGDDDLLARRYFVRYKKWNNPGINDNTEYQNITINIPYSATAGGSAVTVHASTGTNLQLRFVPDIQTNMELAHKGIEKKWDGYGIMDNSTDVYVPLGIMSEQWIINGIRLKSYVNNTANTEISFDHINQSDIHANVVFETPLTGEADAWDDEWNIHLTSVDKNGIESAIGSKVGPFTNTDVTKSPRIDIVAHILNPSFTRSKLIKGYMTSKRNQSYNLQFIIDCKKKTIKSSTSAKEFGCTDMSYLRMYSLASKDLLLPNEIDSYESDSGVLIENALNPNKMVATFKTAVVAKNTLYAGNVYQDGVKYPDRMIKSPIGKAPLLPSTNFIDVATNDGDEIVSLQFFKDRLLQFKRNRLYIISTSEDYEFLQDTVENVGVMQESQITTTPYGVAWINERGCYLYDGQKVNNLTDGRLAYKKWKDSESSWEIDEKYGPVIHYLKKEDKIIVYGATESLENIKENEGTSGGWATFSQNTIGTEYTSKQYLRKIGYQFDFQTKSWSLLTNYTEQSSSLNDDIIDGSLDGRLRVPSHSDMVTNFAYDENGDSIFLMKPINRIVKWDDNPKQTMGYVDKPSSEILTSTSDQANLHRDFRIITKDYDFGAPSVKKKIHKVYVTFKSTDLESHKERKLIQNQDYYSPSHVGVYYAINGKNTWTEFSETKSDNYGTKGLMLTKAETLTTLSSNVYLSETTITVASASNIKVGDVLSISPESGWTVADFEKRQEDIDEQMLVTSVSGTTIGVRRNYNSTIAGVNASARVHPSGNQVYISSGDWIIAELKPSSSINNINSFKLRFSTKKITDATEDDNGVPPGFMINDISVIYRIKNVR